MIGLVALAGFWLLICIAGAIPTLNLHKAHVVPLSPEAASSLLTRVLSEGPVSSVWAEEHNFVPTGAHRVIGLPGEPRIVSWVHQAERTYACIYVLPDGKMPLDFITLFQPEPGESEQGSLTTGSLSDGLLLPNSEHNRQQAFDFSSAEAQWQRHREGVEYLMKKHGYRLASPDGDLATDFAEAIASQGRYVRSLPLWWLRIPYWYFVKKNLQFNKTVAELDRAKP